MAKEYAFFAKVQAPFHSIPMLIFSLSGYNKDMCSQYL